MTLFIIMAEALGRNTKISYENNEIKGVFHAPNCIVMTHHQFVDDIIFIGRAKIEEAINFKKILNLYKTASHQKVNFQKTKLYLLNCFEIIKKQVTRVWNCKVHLFPTRYLGMPLYI